MQVAIGIIFNREEQILIAKRPEGRPYAHYWEFPGGKVETGESHFAALVRELQEEVGILVKKAHYWKALSVEQFILHVYLVDDFTGQVEGKEDQLVKWVTRKQLNTFQFLPANDTLIQELQEWSEPFQVVSF